jgi:hypothetical protein
MDASSSRGDQMLVVTKVFTARSIFRSLLECAALSGAGL